jgi:hypothetical protein
MAYHVSSVACFSFGGTLCGNPSKTGQLRHPADMNKPLRAVAQDKVNTYQHT